MKPYRFRKRDFTALGVVTSSGCIISVFSILITIAFWVGVIYAGLWLYHSS